MNKKKLLTGLVFSTMILGQATLVNADETVATPIDSSTPIVETVPVEVSVTEVVAPVEEQPVETVVEPVVTEVETPVVETPIETVTETPQVSEEPVVDSSTPVAVDTEATQPELEEAKPAEVAPVAEDKVSEETTEAEPTLSPAIGTSNPGPSTNAVNLISAAQASLDNQTQVGTYSEEAEQIVSPVSKAEPVVTQTGYTIVGTQDSQVVVQTTQGTTVVVDAETVGAVVNKDKTVSVITDEGKKVTLPSTGEVPSFQATMIGLAMLIFGAVKKKQREDFI